MSGNILSKLIFHIRFYSSFLEQFAASIPTTQPSKALVRSLTKPSWELVTLQQSPQMRPRPAPLVELSTTPEKPCTPLQDALPSDIAPPEVALSESEPNHPESLPTSISLTTDRSAEDDHASTLAMPDMQLARPSSVPTHHRRQRVMVLLKSVNISLAGKAQVSPDQSPQHASTEVAANEGESIAPRHRFDTAYIEGTFDRIEYG